MGERPVWGNRNRLARESPGTPFEPLPGGSSLRKEGFDWNKEGYLLKDGATATFAPKTRQDSQQPSKEELIKLLVEYKGNTEKIAEKLNRPKSTIGVWLNRSGLKSTEYKQPKANDELQ